MSCDVGYTVVVVSPFEGGCFFFSLFFLVLMALMTVEAILTCSPHELCTILFSLLSFFGHLFSCLSPYPMHVAISHARSTDFVPFCKIKQPKN